MRTVPRALVLSTGKAAFDTARARLAGRVRFLDLVKEGGPAVHDAAVPVFAPEHETLDVVDRLMAARPFTRVLSTSESNVAFAGFLRSRYGIAGISYDQALLATNKWRMKEHLRGVLPMASCWLSGDFLEGAGRRAYPGTVVVKPLSGSSSKGVRMMPARQALAELPSEDGLFLVEEAVETDAEYQCNGVVRDGSIVFVLPAVYDRPVLQAVGANVGSIHLPSRDPRWKQVVAATERVIDALGVPDCVFHLELLERGGELLFGEIGLRPVGGGVADSVRHFYGVDLWEEHIRADLRAPTAIGTPPHTDLYCGAVGIAAGPPSAAPLPEEEVRALPGIVGLAPWHAESRARREAGSGSSVGFTHLALFEGAGEREVMTTITGLRQLSPVPR